MMRGVGGPLLCIGDLLSDVGQSDPQSQSQTLAEDLHFHLSPPPSSPLNLDLSSLFQLCSTLDTADKLIKTTNLNIIALSEKVSQLEEMIQRRDADVAQVRSIHTSLIQNAASSNNRLG